MYHKTSDEQTTTLAEWLHSGTSNLHLNGGVAHHKSVENEAKELAIPMARPSKNDIKIKNLKAKKEDIRNKILKIDDEIIDQDSNSKGQVGLMKIRRTAMKTIFNALELQIEDLEG